MLPVGSFGHKGFTGTMLWVDPATRTYLVVLSSRVYPDGEPHGDALRDRVFGLVVAALAVSIRRLHDTGRSGWWLLVGLVLYAASRTFATREESELAQTFGAIVPEAAQYLANRDVVEIARSTVFNHRPDAICVSGLIAGSQTDTAVLRRVKEALPSTPVFANTGVRPENIKEQLKFADGAVVGTTFKLDGIFENHVDETRVKAFMAKAKSLRSG